MEIRGTLRHGLGGQTPLNKGSTTGLSTNHADHSIIPTIVFLCAVYAASCVLNNN